MTFSLVSEPASSAFVPSFSVASEPGWVTAVVVVVVAVAVVIAQDSGWQLERVLYPLQMPVANVAGSSQV